MTMTKAVQQANVNSETMNGKLQAAEEKAAQLQERLNNKATHEDDAKLQAEVAARSKEAEEVKMERDAMHNKLKASEEEATTLRGD